MNESENEVVEPDAVEPAGAPSEESSGISQPSKLIRIATMARAMLEEVRLAPLDEGGRARMMEVHDKSLDELREVLPDDLLEEFNDIFVPLQGEPSEPELRLAQAQLIGWLEGVFHGIQATLFSQQVAAQSELAEVQKRAQIAPPETPGQYL